MTFDEPPPRATVSNSDRVTALHSLPIAVVLARTDGLIAYANARFQQHFGVTQGALATLFAATSREPLAELLAGATNSALLQRVDGAQFGVEVQRMEEEQITALTLNPIPYREEPDDQRSRRLEAIVQLAAGVAHEVNNPLAVIQGRLELIELLGIDIPPALEPHLRIIDQHARRITRIVRSLQGVARPGLQPRTETSVRELLEGVCAMGGAALTGLEYEIDVQPPELTARVDARQLQRALLNLLDNAADAMPNGGRVWLTARPENSVVRIEVRDAGPGIPAEVLPHLFAPFVSGRPRAERSGLGLAVTRGIVQEHGGTLSASNLTDGGACFTMTLPGVVTPQAASPEESDPTHAPRLRILCVEDEMALLQMVQGMARAAGHDVVTAHDAEEALELAKHHPFDVVLTDVHLPGRSGLELRRALFAFAPELARRTLLMSGYYQDLPPDIPYLQKPFRMKHLLDALTLVSRR